MGNANAYVCDGPGCEVLGIRESRKRGPDGWKMIVISKLEWNDPDAVGVFHSDACATAWLQSDLGLHSLGELPKVDAPVEEPKAEPEKKPSTSTKKEEIF